MHQSGQVELRHHTWTSSGVAQVCVVCVSVGLNKQMDIYRDSRVVFITCSHDQTDTQASLVLSTPLEGAPSVLQENKVH